MLRHRRNDGDLSWFMSEGLASFEKSTFGPLLERAKLFGLPSEKRRAHGPLTVRPRAGHSAGEPSYTPDIDTLVRYGDVSRRLAAIEAVDPISVQALALYYGDEGAKWSLTNSGRWVALYPLTRDGKNLIDWARENAKPPAPEIACLEGYRGLSDFDRLKQQVDKDWAKPDPKSPRRAFIQAAQRQAIVLQMRADDAWLWSGLEKEAFAIEEDVWGKMIEKARRMAA